MKIMQKMIRFLGSIFETDGFIASERRDAIRTIVAEKCESRILIDSDQFWAEALSSAFEFVDARYPIESFDLRMMDEVDAMVAHWVRCKLGELIVRHYLHDDWGKMVADEDAADMVFALGCAEEIRAHRWNQACARGYDVWEDQAYLDGRTSILAGRTDVRGGTAAAYCWVIEHWGRWFIDRSWFEIWPLI